MRCLLCAHMAACAFNFEFRWLALCASRGGRPAGEREERKQATALRKQERNAGSEGALASGAEHGSETGEPDRDGSDKHDDSDAGGEEDDDIEDDDDTGSAAEAAWGGTDA